MKKIAIIGAGLSGITLALLLNPKLQIDIFEKSRGPGGRMATKRKYPFIFDHGATNFSINSPDFKNFLKPLFSKNIIKPWVCKYAKFKSNNIIEKKEWLCRDNHYVGVPNMNSIVKFLSEQCNVLLNKKVNKITMINHKWNLCDENNKEYNNYDWVVCSMPAEQVCTLIPKKISFYSSLKSIKMHGCYSLMLGLNNPINLQYDIIHIVNHAINSISVNSSKPGRNNKFSLVIKSSYKWTKKNINSSETKLIENLLSLSKEFINLNLGEDDIKLLHKWRFVEADKYPTEDYFIDITERVAVCGDWFINSKVEGAYLSAKRLSKNINRLI